ncbi:zinc finger, CCHC-type containing protein [Tanacetum coccineum]
MGNSMLSYSGLSEGFWGEAMLTACYLLNRVPNKRNKTIPYELWFYVIEANGSNHKGIIPNSVESQKDDHSDDVPSEILEPRKVKTGGRSKPMMKLYISGYFWGFFFLRTFWKEAIDDEIGSIMENKTWVLSDLPPGCKWIFKRKMKVDGTIDKFKARLVIQGFRQKKGIDYFDTYAPVARITTIRLLLALAAIHNLVIHQTDVKTTFLNGDLDEVYMKQPEGFVMPGNEHKVCKLVKSLYGLKQALKQWHQKFDEVVLSSGFLLNQSDKCVYSKFDSSGKGVIICLYVDDMLIFGTDQNQVDKTKKFLSSKFSMKDMGEADVILGIKIKRENKGIVITQSHYIEKILKKFNREDCSPVSTPMDPVEKLKPNTGKPVDQLEYSRAIGCLMYAMISTRPDIAYAVCRLSRFTSNPSRQHWKAITRVFKYLRGYLCLFYMQVPSVLEVYSDASWINHVEDSSSTSGWVFRGGAISLAFKKQTSPCTPQQNDVAERKNKALKEMGNSMLSYSGLSEGFWGEAMLTACYLLNRVPNKRNKTTPYELWYKKRPNLSYLRVWGCRVVVRLPDPKMKTLGEKGIDCIFVGYAEHSKAYRFYVIEANGSVSINSIIESRDAIFDENRFSSIPRPKDIIPNSVESQRDDHSDDVPSEILEPRKGKRVRKAKSYGSDFHLYLVEGSRDHIGSQYSYCYSIEEDPRTYDEAIQSRDAAFWKEAIDDEIGSIMENKTWVLSDLPPGCKWIFKRKMKVDGTIDKFKARLVIQGFRQKEGIDYFDTYAPVARITTIRLLLALAAIHNLVIHQMDVKTAFLNGDLDEEVYMKQPEGFVMPGNEHKVCKLVKSLYGLKQAPKQWHQKFDEVVLSSGFHLNQSDKCVYSKFDSSGKGVIICLYVDDMLIFGTDQNQVDKTKKFLSSKFSMKDMGEADVILGIKIKRENKGIVITQSHYIEKILKKFNREDCSPVSTPMDPVEKLKPNTGKPVDQLEYSRAIGCLMYAMTSTRPDIAYAVGRLSRFTSNPSRQHWKAITRVFKYLRDSSSTSGWVFLLGGGAISLAFKKQTCITSSTMKSEFVALVAAGKEAEWLRNLIYEIPIWQKPIAPISIRCDSAPTMARAYSQIYNGKSRHLC